MRFGALALLWLSVLATALMAGFFWTYSVSVMPGLDAAPAAASVPAMRGINAVIRTPVFGAGFFGALALPVLAAGLAVAAGLRTAALLALAAALSYGIAFGVTFVVNVPMNEALAAARPAPAGMAALWSGYAPRWTAWNHLRALTSAVAFLCAVAALLTASRPAPR